MASPLATEPGWTGHNSAQLDDIIGGLVRSKPGLTVVFCVCYHMELDDRTDLAVECLTSMLPRSFYDETHVVVRCGQQWADDVVFGGRFVREQRKFCIGH